MPSKNVEGFTNVLQEDSSDGDHETPRKKVKKSDISEKVKQNKTGLCSVWEEMKNSRLEREQNQERRHQGLIDVRNRAIDVFAEKMDKLLEKINK